jgi:hypothetical protein
VGDTHQDLTQLVVGDIGEFLAVVLWDHELCAMLSVGYSAPEGGGQRAGGSTACPLLKGLMSKKARTVADS